MSWPVGTLVVCINDAHDPSRIITGVLSRGSYYVIRRYIGAVMPFSGTRADGVLLQEIRSKPSPLGGEWCFAAKAFRIAETSIREVVTESMKKPVHHD